MSNATPTTESAMTTDYTTAPACKLLATRCVACGRALVDAVSVEAGIGPVCRKKYDYFAGDAANRPVANKLVHEAALDATTTARRLEIADEVDALGYTKLAGIIRKRFLKAAVTIAVTEDGRYIVNSRWEPSFTEDLKATISWRERTVEKTSAGKFGGWRIAPIAKEKIWTLIQRHFAGETGIGPKGVFEIPAA